MTYLFILLITFSAFSQEALHSYGSKDRPAPFDSESFSVSAKTYETVDWRNKEGINWLGPIRNQSNCGACVAFATVATLEDQQTISTRAAWKREAFSQEALFSCGRAKCNSGWFILDAAKTVEKIGVVDIACAPYKAGSAGKTVACGNFCENQNERTLKIKSITHPDGAAEVKEYLKNHGPLVTTMSVRSGFDSYTGGVFKSSINDDVLGGHAVELVGYNDTERYWIIKNSWGPDWGEMGFARMSYDDVSGVGADTYGFDMDGDVSGIESPLDHEYVQGSISIKGHFVEVDLTQNDYLLKTLTCNGLCSIDSKVLTDGEYVLKTIGTNGRIQTRRFTVMNSVPDFKMTVKSAVNSDFNYPQFGRLVFEATFVGEKVPELLIMEIHQKGKLITSRSVREVFPSTRIGFNSNALKNGPYEISFKHKTFGKVVEGNSFKVVIKND